MNTPAPGPDLDVVDEWLTLPDIAERLALDVGKVRQLVTDRRLLGVRRGEGGVVCVPADFLVPGHLANPAAPTEREGAPAWTVLSSLQGTFTVLADAGFSDAEAIAWLFTPDDLLAGTPMAALRAGRKTEVRRRAQIEL